ncbi:hypothetical protein SLA2020_197130 [Shorea laevis]
MELEDADEQRHNSRLENPESEEEQKHENELARMDMEGAGEQRQSSRLVNPEREEEQNKVREQTRLELEGTEEGQYRKKKSRVGRRKVVPRAASEEEEQSRVNSKGEEEQRHERQLHRWDREGVADQRYKGEWIRCDCEADEVQRQELKSRWTSRTQQKRKKKVRLCRSVYLREGAAGEGKKNQQDREHSSRN